MQFSSLQDLSSQFRNGKIKTLEPEIVIGEQTYRLKAEQVHTLNEMAKDQKRNVIVYQSLDASVLVFGWGLQEGLKVVPLDVKEVSIQNESIITDRDRIAKVKSKYEDRMIGQTVQIVLSGMFQNEPIIAKVDTGASCCSLDAQDLSIARNPNGDGEVVTFTFRNRKYRMLIQQYQAVSSADGGVKNRPVVKFTVRYRDIVLSDVLFNLNDRDGMEYDCLIGLNFLQAGKFLVDPLKEDVTKEEWELYQTLFEGVEAPKPSAPFSDFLTQFLKDHPELLSVNK